MNSDLTQTKNVESTDNPQDVSSPAVGASKASDFQQAAGTEVLSQNQSLSVSDNGQRITPVRSSGTDFGTYAIIFIGSIIFFVVTKRLFAWVQAAPKETKSEASMPVATVPKPMAKKKPKKQSRSKRRQSK